MSEPASGVRRPNHGYYRGLDGLRGLAVAAVVLYHGGVSWAQGGFLGVEAFFVLSGFLITSLLVTEWRRSSSIQLRAFWGRRARRLLPALLCLVSVIGLYYAISGPSKAVPGLQGDGLSTLLYAGNWHQISAGSSYFAASGPVSPLKHTWSLAIEEQFYVFWPVLVLGLLLLVRRRVRKSRRVGRRALRLLLLATVAGVVASAIDTAVLLGGGASLDRVYYGTDTRASSLLMGAALAVALALFEVAREDRMRLAPDRRPARVPAARAGRRALGPASVVALIAVLATMLLARGGSHWLYPAGMLGVDLAVAALIAAIVLAPESRVGRTLSWRPLVALGTISYGVYLWHFPLFLWLDSRVTGLQGTPLLVLRVGATLLISVISFVLIEQPIRRHRMPAPMVRWLAPVAAVGAAASILFGSTFAAVPVGEASAAVAPKAPPSLRGSHSACTVVLRDTSEYGLAPYPAASAAGQMFSALFKHEVTWSGTATRTFHTCPPRRVLLVGDSLAYTLGVGMMMDEQRYGVEIANAASLGCAFTTSGELDVGGTWENVPAGCPTALQDWARLARDLHVKAVVVELGYRDLFDWQLSSGAAHLGQPAFDAAVKAQIDQYANTLSAGGAKVLFLTVPWSQPPDEPNGSPAAATSPERHAEINGLLWAAAAKAPSRVGVIDIDRVISPQNRYQQNVNGQECRFDGIHFTFYCSKLLEPTVLGTVRRMTG